MPVTLPAGSDLFDAAGSHPLGYRGGASLAPPVGVRVGEVEGEVSVQRPLRYRSSASVSSCAFPAPLSFHFTGIFRRPSVRMSRQGRGLPLVIQRRTRLDDEKRHSFLSSFLDHPLHFLNGSDDEFMGSNAHLSRHLGNFVVGVFVEFDRNLNVVHMYPLNHFSRSLR